MRCMMTVSVLLLVMMMVVAGRVASGAKEEVDHGTPVRHGKQDHDVDGHHNVHFDHEAILGSYKLEEEFEDLPPEEAKKRLSMLVKKMDKNHDFYVTKEELADWIMMSFRLLDEEEALEDRDDYDENEDGKVTWAEFLKSRFSYSQAEIDEMRRKGEDDVLTFLTNVDEEERRFKAADLDKDGALDKDEFIPFTHPHNYDHMHKLEVETTIQNHDKNKDGFLSLQEYIGSNEGDSEWLAVETERFKDYDTNKDNQLNYDEVKLWVMSDNTEEAMDEADHLLKKADVNGDGKLTEREIVDAHEDFVGSQATDYGFYLNFVKHKDEL